MPKKLETTSLVTLCDVSDGVWSCSVSNLGLGVIFGTTIVEPNGDCMKQTAN